MEEYFHFENQFSFCKKERSEESIFKEQFICFINKQDNRTSFHP